MSEAASAAVRGNPPLAMRHPSDGLRAALAGIAWGIDTSTVFNLALLGMGACVAVSVTERSIGRHAVLGLVAGFISSLLSFSWVAGAWSRFDAASPAEAIAALAGVALFGALPHGIAWGVAAAAQRRGTSRPLAWFSAYYLAETVSRHVHPWPEGLGFRLLDVAALAAPAALWGAPILSAACIGLAAVATQKPTATLPYLGIWLLCAPLVEPDPEGPTLRVAIVQPDFDAFDMRRTSTADARRQRLERLLLTSDRAGADLIVTPEGSWPHPVGHDGDYTRTKLESSWRLRAAVLLGAERPPANLMLRAADQRVTDVYTKKYLTPGGERQWLGWGKDRFTPGDQPRVFPVADVPVGVAICYEDLVFATARELQGAQWIALTSNDSWLGAAGMHFHLRAARRLAIEQGRWVARATVNGMSTFIDPLGRLYPGERLTDGAQGQAWILPVPLRKLQLPQTLFRPILLIACAVGILRPLNAAPRRRSPASE